MLVILLAPSLAVLLDLLRNKVALPRSVVYATAAIISLPSLIVWLTGYVYSNSQVNYTAVAIVLTAILLVFQSLDSGEPSGKVKAMLVLTLLLGTGIAVKWIMSLYTGKATVYQETTFQAYKATHSRDYDQVLLGPERITVKKIRVFGWIEKVLVTEKVNVNETAATCLFRFRDGKRAFDYNYCNNSITPIKSTAGNMSLLP